MKKRKRIIKDPKARGEWAETVFMARAGEQGLAVSKPWGDSRSYDFVVGRPGNFVSVQVKSTICRSGGGYECCLKGRRNEAYRRGSFDFLAAYVVMPDTWYIIPAEKVLGKETVCLYSESKYAKYERYREAWYLLREAAEAAEAAQESSEISHPSNITKCGAPAPAEAAPRFPRNAVERMEYAFNFFRRQMERGGVPAKDGEDG